MVASLVIGGRTVGPGAPCFVIAEAGVNHNGSVESACRLAEVAHACGADAVKFQTFRAERLVSPGAPYAEYQRRAIGAAESPLEMLRALELSPEAHEIVRDRCRALPIVFLSTPFDEQSADFLDGLGVPAFKIPSGEITNLPLLDHIARKRKPIIVSTGMADLAEVEAAVSVLKSAGNEQIALLQCVSNYPAAPQDVNLRAMDTMARAFGLPIGYSDHTLGGQVALAAVARGACIIEKHVTLSRSLPGPDHQASMEPEELRDLVTGIRMVEAALGGGRKEPAPSETGMAAVVRKSLVAASDIAAGTVLTEDMVTVMRPGTGLPPAMRPSLMGRRTRVEIPRGTVIGVEMLS